MGQERLTPGLAFVGAGFGLLGVTAAIEAYLVLGGAAAEGILSQDLTRLALVPWAMGLVFFGYALDHPEVLWDKARGRRVFATYLLFADGAIHLLAIGEHVDLPVVAFFAVLAPLQLASAWFLLRGRPAVLGAWLVGSLGLIALYVASRFAELPFVAAQYRVEPLGILSKGIEILLVAALVQELRVTLRVAKGARAGRPAA
jgi:hypothetical protein